jgi:hypothetical protein
VIIKDWYVSVIPTFQNTGFFFSPPPPKWWIMYKVLKAKWDRSSGLITTETNWCLVLDSVQLLLFRNCWIVFVHVPFTPTFPHSCASSLSLLYMQQFADHCRALMSKIKKNLKRRLSWLWCLISVNVTRYIFNGQCFTVYFLLLW